MPRCSALATGYKYTDNRITEGCPSRICFNSTNLTSDSKCITDASTPFTFAVAVVCDSVRVVEADAAVQTLLASLVEFFTRSRLYRLNHIQGKAVRRTSYGFKCDIEGGKRTVITSGSFGS